MTPWPKVLSMKSFSIINEEAQEFFSEFGWVLTDGLNIEQTRLLQQWVQEVDNWEIDGTFLRHEEMTSEGPKVARIEYFTHIHQGLGEFLASGQMLKDASALLGEQAVLYKEKINFKLSGGAGWSPHQDAPAYPFIRTHISCMVAVDDATIENGCLEVVSHAHEELLPQDKKGCIRADIVDVMTWEPVELKAGQTLWFHSLTPHQSSDNLSQRNRRALYPTYNALSEGDLRQEYYEEKMKAFMEMNEGGDTVRVSLVDDFRGIPVR